ncbi:hypothetical protein [Salinicola tamaricis]|uniref:hypothetical protein n=1 Tax=Salinicola tamaricis TaxID=1771309 RepID=UPI001F5D9E12|nr:hypothetical protein [Salinicola tamaricis]
MFELADYWLANGMIDTLAHEQRQLLAERQSLTARRLAGHAIDARPSSLHAWIALPSPWRAEELKQQARQEGVAITTAQPFLVAQTPAPQRVRLSLGAESDLGRLAHALDILARLIGEARHRCWKSSTEPVAGRPHPRGLSDCRNRDIDDLDDADFMM